jgi:hypothetical protein
MENSPTKATGQSQIFYIIIQKVNILLKNDFGNKPKNIQIN